MKIRINNRVVDMPLRRFEFSSMAKENTKYISDKEFNDIENDFLSINVNDIWSDLEVNNLFTKYFEHIACYLNYCSPEEFQYNRRALQNFDRVNVVRLPISEDIETDDI